MIIIDKIARKINKIHRKIKVFRLRPISVFLFHQVSDEFDASTMKMGDWSQTVQFKNNIEKLMDEYTFIPLDQAYLKMKKDKFRFRKYAALTSDDGWASLNNILPWLEEKKVPVTLFLNPGYFDGEHFRETPTEKYLLAEDIKRLDGKPQLVAFGLHGWDHVDAMKQTQAEFKKSVADSYNKLSKYRSFTPYFAYTYGSFDEKRDVVINSFGLTPVLIDGEENVDDVRWIHRELLDGKEL